MKQRVVDLSHPISDGMAVYPGLPRPRIDLLRDERHAGADERAGFAIGRFQWVANVATYLDSPAHRYLDGCDVSELDLATLIDLPTTIIDASATTATRRLGPRVVAGPLTGRAVLFHTGWSRRWSRADYWEPAPFLTQALVERLVAARPALVGIDTWNVDDPEDPHRPAHSDLLRAGIPIVEHLRRLDELDDRARTSFVPLAVIGAPSVPIRAFASWPETGAAPSTTSPRAPDQTCPALAVTRP
jgi:arylformamidase